MLLGKLSGNEKRPNVHKDFSSLARFPLLMRRRLETESHNTQQHQQHQRQCSEATYTKLIFSFSPSFSRSKLECFFFSIMYETFRSSFLALPFHFFPRFHTTLCVRLQNAHGEERMEWKNEKKYISDYIEWL
jgi:hypothetical protein